MVEMTQKEKYNLKRQIEALKACKGKHTELISLYIPPNKQIYDVNSYLKNELSQSQNIKSKTTRKNVLSAIESIMSRLKYFKQTSENGLVFFVGHKSAGSDQTEMVAHVIEPPMPICTFLYRCDSLFYTEPLEQMLLEKEIYGILLIDRRECTVGILRGKPIVGSIGSQIFIGFDLLGAIVPFLDIILLAIIPFTIGAGLSGLLEKVDKKLAIRAISLTRSSSASIFIE